MILEITGTGTRNKGAELMLIAIVRRFANCSKTQFAVNAHFGSYQDRSEYGLFQKVKIDRMGRSRLAFSLMPDSFRKNCGLVTERQIEGVVDASGFAFGDQLPVATAQRFAADCVRWKSQNKKIILLPQAFGPFETEPARAAFRQIAQHADLLYARDENSLLYAQQAAPEYAEKLSLGPDITIGLCGEPSAEHSMPDNTALIIPNVRMLDLTTPEEAQAYVPCLARCAGLCRDFGLEPMILIHDDGEDQALIEMISRELGSDLPVLREADPLKLKWLIKQAHIVIGSRFHSLVGALSGSVPAIAIGWSHKYVRLFEDFQCSEMVLSVSSESEVLGNRIKRLVEERGHRSDQLKIHTEQYRDDLDQLWETVIKELLLT